jgi:GST-like protein
MLTLYGGSSPNVRKVSILLEEVELEHDYRHMNVHGGELYTADFARLNPMKKIPVLVDSEGPQGEPCTVFESGAILIYLAEKTRRFLPASGASRYCVLQWLMVQMASIGPSFGQFTHFRRFAPGVHEYALRRYETQAVTLFETLDERLAESQFLGGEDYSIADMATYPWIANRHNTWGGGIESFTNVQRWFDLLTARPAVQRMLQAYAVIQKSSTESMLQATPEETDRFMGRGRYAKSWPGADAQSPRAENIYDRVQEQRETKI